MKIRLFIVEQDENYLEKISSVFNSKYSDKLEVYAFSDVEMAEKQASLSHADVVLANADLKLSADDFPIGCEFALLTDQPDVTSIDGVKAINKYQRADAIYKEVLDCFANSHANVVGKNKSGKAKLIVFASPAGGTGSSSLCVAVAKKYAEKGGKCLYLNLEKYGVPENFFYAEGEHSFTDIIFALKSKKANLELKLESSVKQDESGVYFFGGTENAMDMQELKDDEIDELVKALVNGSPYDCVFLDTDYSVSGETLELLQMADSIVLTSDGSEIANAKTQRAYEVLKVIEEEKGKDITRKCLLFYNKYSNKVSKEIEGTELRSIGGAPKYEHASTAEVVAQLSKLDALDEII